MIRLYRFPLSTNVERVALAFAHKKIPVTSVVIDPADRGEVKRLSGQELVPAIVDEANGHKVVFDSMEIIRYMEDRYPSEPLYPKDEARRAEMLVFIDWFNRVWKRPPNEITVEMERPEPDRQRIERLGTAMTEALDLFEAMLSGRDYLMGEFSAADCAAFPFVKYALINDDRDPYLFHKVLVDYQPLGTNHPRLEAWIRRCDRHPRA